MFTPLRFHTILTLLSTALLLPSACAQTPSQLSNITTPTLNLTAIATRDHASIIQCWQLTNKFTLNTQAGTSGALNLFLGNLSNASYTVIPPRFDGGVHNAPSPQYVVFLSGLAHVTLPNTTVGPTTEAWIQGGKFGVLLAVDDAAVSRYGHVTTYPGDSDTVTLQVPLEAGKIPDHQVLYDGPCGWAEMVGT